ncbi:MAG: slipin family protein [Chitinophagales bacterium]|nr:slipin family protein [Chitinophagales bacterium]
MLIPTNHIALVFKREKLTRILHDGKHWLWPGEKAELYNMSEAFLPSQELNVLLQNAELASLLQVFEVADHEIALLYRDGLFHQVLTAGKFAFWKGATAYHVVKADITRTEEVNIDLNLISKNNLANYLRVVQIAAFEKGILLINSAVVRALEPGSYFFWKNQDSVSSVKTDMRQMTVDILGQEVLTRDKAQLRINATAQYRVTDIMKALVENKDFDKQLYTQMQMALREMVGKLSFDELMESKDQIAQQVLANAAEKARELGVELVDFGVKDIVLPGDVKEIMNQVLIAEKRAQANVIMRREETASTRSLMNTAKLMEENAMLLKLKEMEYVEKIAEKIQTIQLSGGGQLVDQLKQLFVR